MKFFDLHCDTIQKIVEEGANFTDEEGLHLNLSGVISSNTIAQVFACFIFGAKNPNKEFEICNSFIDAIEDLVATYKDRLIITRSAKDLQNAVTSENKTAVIIAIEGATPLNGDVNLIEFFYNRGVRLLTIAWDDNEFCGTVFGQQGGLTPLGEKLIRNCNDLGIIVDISHASDQAFYDVASITKIPFVASHSNARKVCSNNRNLTDDMIRVIGERGGIIGLTYGSGFISPEYYKHEKKCRDKILTGLRDNSITFKDAHKISDDLLSDLQDASISELVMHAKHIIDIGGEDCLGLGSDFDGVTSIPKEMSGAGSLPVLVQEMESQGINASVIDKITYENSYRYFLEML